ncbi:MAG: hypothetical protein HRT47_06050 [Candidatus Caenarcaniphilales bacterium]|nr:hypothetical protein [Candidatus Caenarcaniphilales bacterium]
MSKISGTNEQNIYLPLSSSLGSGEVSIESDKEQLVALGADEGYSPIYGNDSFIHNTESDRINQKTDAELFSNFEKVKKELEKEEGIIIDETVPFYEMDITDEQREKIMGAMEEDLRTVMRQKTSLEDNSQIDNIFLDLDLKIEQVKWLIDGMDYSARLNGVDDTVKRFTKQASAENLDTKIIFGIDDDASSAGYQDSSGMSGKGGESSTLVIKLNSKQNDTKQKFAAVMRNELFESMENLKKQEHLNNQAINENWVEASKENRRSFDVPATDYQEHTWSFDRFTEENADYAYLEEDESPEKHSRQINESFVNYAQSLRENDPAKYETLPSAIQDAAFKSIGVYLQKINARGDYDYRISHNLPIETKDEAEAAVADLNQQLNDLDIQYPEDNGDIKNITLGDLLEYKSYKFINTKGEVEYKIRLAKSHSQKLIQIN